MKGPTQDRLHCPHPTTLSPLGGKLFTLAERDQHFTNAFTEWLSFEGYDGITDLTAKMLACGNLLECRDRKAFLNREIQEAEEQLVWFRQRLAALVD